MPTKECDISGILISVYLVCFFASALLLLYHSLILDGIAAIIVISGIYLVFKLNSDPIEAEVIFGIMLATWLVTWLITVRPMPF
jgi:hypothetical protein